MRSYRVTPTVLEEWVCSENASWEDHGTPDDGHVYCVLTRAKTVIKVENDEEAEWLVHSAYFQGDALGIDSDLVKRREAIDRLGRRIACDFGIAYEGGLWYKEQ